MKRWIMIGLAALAILASQVACDESGGGGGVVGPTHCPPGLSLTCQNNPANGTLVCTCIVTPR